MHGRILRASVLRETGAARGNAARGVIYLPAGWWTSSRMLRGTNGAPRGVPGQQYAEPPAGFHDMLMPAGLSHGTPKRGANNMNRNAVHVCSVPSAETLMCACESSGTPSYRVRTVAGCLSGTSVRTVSTRGTLGNGQTVYGA